MVVLNVQGQVSSYDTATISIDPGKNETAYMIGVGLPSGNYTASVFVLSAEGAVISGTTTLSFTLN